MAKNYDLGDSFLVYTDDPSHKIAYKSIEGYMLADDAVENALSEPLSPEKGGTGETSFNVGEFKHVEQTETAVSMATATYTDIAHVDLEKGIWVVIACASWGTNGTGRRLALLSTTSKSSDASDIRGGCVVTSAISSAGTEFVVSRIFNLTSDSTVYLVGWQNSGDTLNSYGVLNAVRIK